MRARAHICDGHDFRVRLDFDGRPLQIKDLYSDEREGGFVAKFPGADASVVRRSELYRSAKSKEPQVKHSACIPGT